MIKDVHLCYCDYDPLAMDVILNLTEDGIRLVFDPISQRLKIIEVGLLLDVEILLICLGNRMCHTKVVLEYIF